MINQDDITMLARAFIPRLPGSPMERRAARYVVERLEELSIPVAELPVRTPQSFVPVYASIFAVSILGVLIAPFQAWVGFLISLAALVLLLLEINNIPVLSRLLATHHTYNVLGLVPQEHGQEDDEPRRRVILSAHLDAARTGILWHPSLVAWLRPIIMIIFATMVVVPVALLIYALLGDTYLWVIAVLGAVLLLIAGGLLLEQDIVGQPVAGANDNASGVTAVLGLAQALQRNQPRHTEVWLLFTAGKEAGQVGMKRFLSENHFNPETTFFINIDSVGAGHVRYTSSEGLLRENDCSTVMVELARSIVADHPDWDIRSIQHRLTPTDSSVALGMGYQAISLIACGEDGQIPNWHQSTDTPDNIDDACIERATEFAAELVRRLDTQVSTDSLSRIDLPSAPSGRSEAEIEVGEVESYE